MHSMKLSIKQYGNSSEEFHTLNSRVEGVSNQSIEINTENEADKLINNCYGQVFFPYWKMIEKYISNHSYAIIQ